MQARFVYKGESRFHTLMVTRFGGKSPPPPPPPPTHTHHTHTQDKQIKPDGSSEGRCVSQPKNSDEFSTNHSRRVTSSRLALSTRCKWARWDRLSVCANIVSSGTAQGRKVRQKPSTVSRFPSQRNRAR